VEVLWRVVDRRHINRLPSKPSLRGVFIVVVRAPGLYLGSSRSFSSCPEHAYYGSQTCTPLEKDTGTIIVPYQRSPHVLISRECTPLQLAILGHRQSHSFHRVLRVHWSHPQCPSLSSHCCLPGQFPWITFRQINAFSKCCVFWILSLSDCLIFPPLLVRNHTS